MGKIDSIVAKKMFKVHILLTAAETVQLCSSFLTLAATVTIHVASVLVQS